MGTEIMSCCGAPTKVYSDAGKRQHYMSCRTQHMLVRITDNPEGRGLLGVCSCGHESKGVTNETLLHQIHGEHAGVAKLLEKSVEERMAAMGMEPVEITNVWVDIDLHCKTIYVPAEMRK